MIAEDLLKRYAAGERSFVGSNLTHVHLPKVDLRGIDLSHSDLRYAHFDEANLSDANLSHANLDGAWLNCVNLQGANLRSASLQGTQADYSNFRDATLSHAHLSTHWKGVDFSNADLSSISGDCLVLEDANLSHANLSGIRIYQSHFGQANFRGANLDWAFFGDNSHIEKSNLIGVDLSTTCLDFDRRLSGSLYDSETIVPEAVELHELGALWIGTGADLRRANLQNADLSDLDLSEADLRHACLRGANLRSAVLLQANLESADLEGANLTGADLEGAEIENAYMHDVVFCETVMPDGNIRDDDCVAVEAARRDDRKETQTPPSHLEGYWGETKIQKQIRFELALPSHFVPISGAAEQIHRFVGTKAEGSLVTIQLNLHKYQDRRNRQSFRIGYFSYNGKILRLFSTSFLGSNKTAGNFFLEDRALRSLAQAARERGGSPKLSRAGGDDLWTYTTHETIDHRSGYTSCVLTWRFDLSQLAVHCFECVNTEIDTGYFD